MIGNKPIQATNYEQRISMTMSFSINFMLIMSLLRMN
jgi:hypothetical protein